MWYLIAAVVLFNIWLPYAIYTARSEPKVTTCEGCNKPAKYIVYGQAHCQKCFDDAIEDQGFVKVRLIDDATGYPDQSE